MTSEERREVAERLRRCAQNVSDTLDFAMYLSYWVGIDRSAVMDDEGNHFSAIADRRLAEKTLERLADLIDPTCHVSDEEVTHQPTLDAIAVHVYTCDTCSSTFYMGDVCMHPEPLYCPYCGARVVRGGVD